MFEFKRTQVKVLDWNPRKETHGQELVLAGDLKLTVALQNDALAFFDASLKSALYSAAPANAGETQGSTVNDLPHVRFPKLHTPLKWDWEGVGYDFTIHHGVNEQDNIELKVDINSFVFMPMEGGLVVFTFRAQFHPSGAESGRLSELIGEWVTASLEPPSAEPADARDDAESLFDKSKLTVE